jgi:predicted dehydrogenase
MTSVAIVGYGYWGPKLVRNFLQSGRFARVVICESNPDRLRQGLREHPGAEGLASFEELLARPDIGAAAVATPVATHYPLAKALLQAGKHVLVEKPLATRGTEADELVALAAARQRTLMVDHTYVYHPAVQRIQALVRQGELGKLNYIDSTRINLGLFQHDVNVLWDLAVHDLAIVNHLTAERPACVQAVGAAHTRTAPANIGIMILRYASGLFVHLNCSWVSPVKIRHMLIGGDRKMVVYDDLDANEPVKIYDSGFTARTDEERNRLLFEYRAGDVFSPKIAGREALANLVADFVAAIEQGGSPASDGRFAADTVKILEGAESSVKNGGREVFLSWQ